MRRTKLLLAIISAAILLAGLLAAKSLFAVAESANAPSLAISQLKITGSSGQFITLYNASQNAVDMSKYQLQYFNNYDLAKATSSKLISLSGTVPPHSYFMVNDSSIRLCYQMTLESVSLGLSSTAGMIELLAVSQPSPGGPVSNTLQDYVAWSKTLASGAQTLPANAEAFLKRLPLDADNNPAITSPGSGNWQAVQPDSANPCVLKTVGATSTETSSGSGQLLPSAEAPATIVSLDETAKGPVMPALDIGLKAPQVSELLPNPTGTGNDSSDEYIEIYNPNASNFDLTGFILQTGLTTTRKYTFPSGTILPPNKFKAFYSRDTGLTLSNTSSQAKLLDPFGTSLASTEAYGSAKDGQAWAVAKSKWYWTDLPTPNAANTIKQNPASKKTKTASKSTAAKSTSKANGATSFGAEEPAKYPVHAKALAVVVAVAVIYGAYEYRTDIRSHLYKFRRYLKHGRSSRR